MPTEPVKRAPIFDQPRMKVAGELFERWKNVTITTDLNQAAASFNFSMGPLVSDKIDWVKKLAPGTLVEIMFGDRPALRGIIDSQSISLTGTDESLSVSGRDVMGLLVDSSMWLDMKVAKPGDRKSTRTLADFVKEILDRFVFADGTKVFDAAPVVFGPAATEPFGYRARKPNPGETCEQYIRSLAEDRKLDLWLSPEGAVTIGDRAQQREDELKSRATDSPVLCLYAYRSAGRTHQNNFKETRVSRSIVGAGSEYRVFGRVFRSNKNRAVAKVALDATVPVYKPMFTRVDNAEDPEELQRRADSERDKSLANRLQVSGTAAGFGQEIDGQKMFFEPNGIVKVVHEVAGIEDTFYISQVTYEVNASGGPTSAVTLTPIDSGA